MKETVRDAILDVFKLPFHLSMHDTDRFENDAPFRNSPLFKPFSQVSFASAFSDVLLSVDDGKNA